MYEQAPDNIDPVMAIKEQILIIHAINSREPPTTYFCNDWNITYTKEWSVLKMMKNK